MALKKLKSFPTKPKRTASLKTLENYLDKVKKVEHENQKIKSENQKVEQLRKKISGLKLKK